MKSNTLNNKTIFYLDVRKVKYLNCQLLTKCLATKTSVKVYICKEPRTCRQETRIPVYL